MEKDTLTQEEIKKYTSLLNEESYDGNQITLAAKLGEYLYDEMWIEVDFDQLLYFAELILTKSSKNV